MSGDSGSSRTIMRQDAKAARYHVQGLSKVNTAVVAKEMMDGEEATLNMGGPHEKPVETYLSLEYDEDDVRLSKPITPYDREVHNAVATLWVAGNRAITPLQVYRVMTGKEKPRQSAVEEVAESLDKQRRTFVKLYFEDEVRGKTAEFDGEPVTAKECRLETYMLNADKITVVTVNGDEKDGYLIKEAPVLYRHDSITNQITSYPQRLLESTSKTVSMTTRNVLIRSYLIKRVEAMKPGGTMKSHHIRYDSIIKEIGEADLNRKDRNRIIQNVRKLLDALVSERYFIDKLGVAGWSEYADPKDPRRNGGVEIKFSKRAAR